MVCVHCGAKTRVINSRRLQRSGAVWRRRACRRCGSVVSTIESIQYELAWSVRDASGHVQPFSRDKLFLSLHRSCQHRATALRDADALSLTVIRKLVPQTENAIVEQQTIRHTAQVALNRFDTAASVHYAAFHAS